MSAMEKTQAQHSEEKTSTGRKPYHYVGADLTNVYLVGVKYRIEKETGFQQADIPCLPGLLDALAKALLGKRSPLSGDEVRFLRKRLRTPSKEFAGFVGMSSEQYSRIENGATLTPSVDRLVRLLYAALAKLTPEVAEELVHVKWEAALNHEERIVASQDSDHHWIVRTKAA